jgi:hypothetical protein
MDRRVARRPGWAFPRGFLPTIRRFGSRTPAAQPVSLLGRSLFRVRGFVAGLILGSVFSAAVAGLLYATSLYLQFGHGLTPLPAAAVMAPASAGIIVASFSTRGLIERLGRRLVAAGLTISTPCSRSPTPPAPP